MNGASTGRVLVLNGTSSAGKTSLAKALQTVLPEAHLHVQLNAFRDMEPPGYWKDLDPATSELRIEALCRAMHAAVAAHARHGQHVIFDTVLDRASVARYFEEDLRPLAPLLIGVTCAVDELERREQARGDRPLGLARRQAAFIHEGRAYDFSVDTTSTSPEQSAVVVLQWLEQLRSP